MKINHCYSDTLLAYDDALKQILDAIEPISDTEIIQFEDSLDRILAEDIHSNVDLPAWDCSAMDGYAFHTNSLLNSTTLKLTGYSYAGNPFMSIVNEGECIRIMTGACLPEGCNSVEMQENTTSIEQQITFKQKVKELHNVRKKASEVHCGESILNKGSRINPAMIAVLASLGHTQIKVYRRLSIAVFSTGDELITPGEALPFGKIYDSNRYSVLAACTRLGFNRIDLGHVVDDPEAIEKLLSTAAETADAILTTGGVSVGDADYVKPCVEKLGHINLWKVAIKPGKPIAIGTIGHCKFFGLPGNPVSSMVTLNLLVQPALEKLSGKNSSIEFKINAKTTSPLKKKSGRMDFQRGFATQDCDGNWYVASTGYQGSAKISSLANANCYIILDQYSTDIPEGDTVRIQFFNEMLR